jgi:hypothetical protein
VSGNRGFGLIEVSVLSVATEEYSNFLSAQNSEMRSPPFRARFSVMGVHGRASLQPRMETALLLLALILVILGATVVIWNKRHHPKSPALELTLDPVALTPVLPDPAIPDALFIGDLDRPLVQIRPVRDLSGPHETLAVPDSLKQAVLPLVQRAPQIFRLGQEMATKTLRLVFSPEVTQALNDGNLSLLKDTAGELLPVVQRNGKFFKNGRVIVDGGVKLANLAAMSWQIASIVTAQQYLGDIDAKLKNIENALEDVLFILKEDKLSRVRSYVQLLRQYDSALSRGTLNLHETSAICHKLEDLEHECMAIGDLGQQMARQKLEELLTCQKKPWMDRSGSAELVAKLVTESEKAMELVFMANSCRVLGCQVRAALPGDRVLLQERAKQARAEVQKAEAQLRESREQFLISINSLKKRENLVALRGHFDSDYFEGLQLKYGAVEKKAVEACRMLEDQSSNTVKFARQLDEMVKEGISITLEVESTGDVRFLSAEPNS